MEHVFARLIIKNSAPDLKNVKVGSLNRPLSQIDHFAIVHYSIKQFPGDIDLSLNDIAVYRFNMGKSPLCDLLHNATVRITIVEEKTATIVSFRNDKERVDMLL